MPIKLLLTLKEDASPHLYINQIKELIKDDEEILPQMRKCLLLLKKYKKNFIQLPKQVEVVISWERYVTLERSISPSINAYTCTDWTEGDKESFSKNRKAFYDKILKAYEKMGYLVQKSNITLIEVSQIIELIKSKEKK